MSTVRSHSMDGERPLVLLVYEQVCLGASGRAQCVMSGVEESPADPATGMCGMDEEQEHLAVFGVGGGVADDAVGFVDGDEQCIWRLVIGYELLPVLQGEHGPGGEIVEVAPAHADGGVEHRSDGWRVASYGGRSVISSAPAFTWSFMRYRRGCLVAAT